MDSCLSSVHEDLYLGHLGFKFGSPIPFMMATIKLNVLTMLYRNTKVKVCSPDGDTD